MYLFLINSIKLLLFILLITFSLSPKFMDLFLLEILGTTYNIIVLVPDLKIFMNNMSHILHNITTCVTESPF